MDTFSGSPLVEIRTSPVHGRGLFARRDIRPGHLIGIYPLLILSTQDTAALKATRLYHYVFYVDETEAGLIRAAVAFGEISFCNHSREANAFFEVDAGRMEVTLSAERRIAAGDEILIDYEDFADEAL
jgi:uncharacterized protein